MDPRGESERSWQKVGFPYCKRRAVNIPVRSQYLAVPAVHWSPPISPDPSWPLPASLSSYPNCTRTGAGRGGEAGPLSIPPISKHVSCRAQAQAGKFREPHRPHAVRHDLVGAGESLCPPHYVGILHLELGPATIARRLEDLAYFLKQHGVHAAGKKQVLCREIAFGDRLEVE